MSVDVTPKRPRRVARVEDTVHRAEVAEGSGQTGVRTDDNRRSLRTVLRRIWSGLWPKLVAVGIVLLIWQAAYLAE